MFAGGGIVRMSDAATTSSSYEHRAAIPFARPAIGSEESAAVCNAVMSDAFGQSGKVGEFEQAFAELVGVPYAIAVSSCTTALHLGLAAFGIGDGDEVVVPSLSFIATTNAVRVRGRHAGVCRRRSCTQNLTPQSIEPVLSPADQGRPCCTPDGRARRSR